MSTGCPVNEGLVHSLVMIINTKMLIVHVSLSLQGTLPQIDNVVCHC